MRKITLILFLLIAASIFAQSNNYTILISFDGFRWDYLDRGLTPNMQKLIDRGVRAQSLQPCFPSKTFPNHISILTGMYPENHGVISNNIYDFNTGKKYKLSNETEIRNPKWYLGEFFWETAQRNGIKTASYFWPGSQLTAEYRRPDYFEEYEQNRPYKKRVDGIIDWLQLPYKDRPKFLTLYYSLTDTYGHRYGPDSPEVNSAISKLDSVTGYLLQRLSEIGKMDSTNIILVSDHGMTNVSSKRAINIEKILDGYNFYSSDFGPFMAINSDEDIDVICSILKKHENHYKVYKKENVPEYYHYSHHPFINPIVVIADLGWSLGTNRDENKYSGKEVTEGNHGYINYALDMHGIFVSSGPDFKNHLRTGMLYNIDIYPMLFDLF